MNMLGVQFRKPCGNDLYVFSLLTLGFLSITMPVSLVIGAPSHSILAWAMAGASASILSSIGIKASGGVRPILIIGITAYVFSIAGQAISTGLLMMVAN